MLVLSISVLAVMAFCYFVR